MNSNSDHDHDHEYNSWIIILWQQYYYDQQRVNYFRASPFKPILSIPLISHMSQGPHTRNVWADPTIINFFFARVMATLMRRQSVNSSPTWPSALLRTNDMMMQSLSRPK